MADTLKNRLSKLEIEPPQNKWTAIAEELNDYELGQRLSSRLQSYEVNPPENNFLSILASLQKEDELIPEQSSPAKLIDFNWKKVAVAASIIGLSGTLIFFLFFNKSIPGKQERVTTSVVKPAVPETNLAVITPMAIKVEPPAPAQQTAPIVTRKNTIRTVSNLDNASPRYVIASSLISYNDEAKIEVTAPPITDQEGNPILDRSLLTGNNGSYITVTSPNGEQTRISAKFLDYVSKFYDMTNQNDEWKRRFENWKNIMLQEATLTPAPGNFMDLLELKDILIQQ